MSTLANPVPVSPDLRAMARWCESDGNYRAIRFERKTFNNITDRGNTPVLLAIARINKCSLDTARIIYASSWGAYQIMGFNLYDKLGLLTDIASYLWDTNAQDQSYDKFVIQNNINFSMAEIKSSNDKRLTYAIRYNGSSIYADRMIKAIKALNL